MGIFPKEEAHVDQWMDFCSSELDPLLQVIYFPFLEYMEQDERQGRALRSIKEALQFIEDSLQETGHLVGNGSTLADLSVAISLLCPFKDIFMETFSPDLPKLTKFLERMSMRFRVRQLPVCFRELKRMNLKEKKSEKIEGESCPNSPVFKAKMKSKQDITDKKDREEIDNLRSKVELLESETEILKKTILELNLELSDKQFTISEHAPSSKIKTTPLAYTDTNVKLILSKTDLSPKSAQIEEVEEPSEGTSSKKDTNKNSSGKGEYYHNRKISIANTFGKGFINNNKDQNSDSKTGEKKSNHTRNLTFKGTDGGEFTPNSGTNAANSRKGVNSDHKIDTFQNPFHNNQNRSPSAKNILKDDDESSELIENYFKEKPTPEIEQPPVRDNAKEQKVEVEKNESIDGSQFNTSIHDGQRPKYPNKSSLRNMYKTTKQKSTIGFTIPDEKPAIRRALARQNTMALPKEGDEKILNKGRHELQAQFIENELDDSLDQFNTSEVRATPEVEIKAVSRFPSIREMKTLSHTYAETPIFANHRDHKRSFEKQIPSFEKFTKKSSEILMESPKEEITPTKADRMERESNFSMTDLEMKMAKWSKFTKKK